MSDLWLLRALRWSYVAFITAASVAALRSVVQGGGESHHGAHVLALAGVEALAAAAFLIEPIELIACSVLLLVYLAATALSVAAGDLLAPLRFCYFAATAIFIVLAHRKTRTEQRAG
jgi:hypothetical protein